MDARLLRRTPGGVPAREWFALAVRGAAKGWVWIFLRQLFGAGEFMPHGYC